MTRPHRRRREGARRGSSATHRAQWRATYERSRYSDLPWFAPGPSSQVREAVRTRFWPKGGAVLDVGCGAGSNVLFLARSGFEAHGIDLSPGAVRAARDRASRSRLTVDVQEGDALAMPFPTARFDGVMDNGCFHTLPLVRRRDYAAEVARVLRPGGGFLLSWVAREHTPTHGPRHRPSLEEVTDAFESRFLFSRTQFVSFSERDGPSVYVAWTIRRTAPQPPPR